MNTFKFHRATMSFGESVYPITAEVFPVELSDPDNSLAIIEEGLNRGRGNRKFSLSHYYIPAYPGYSPAFHVYHTNGVSISYREESE